MTMVLRLLLVAVSILNGLWILRRIRLSQAKIEDSIFWFAFSAILLLMSLFPGLVNWGAKLLGVQSTVNFVFLVIIFVLIVKLFLLSLHVSRLENKLQTFVQNYAIRQKEEER